MFDIGGPEFLLLVVLGLLIFGPRRLPEVGKQLGGFIAQLRNAMKDFQGTLEREVALEDIKGAAAQVTRLKDETTGMARDLIGMGKAPFSDVVRALPPGTLPAGAAGLSSVALPPDAADAVPLATDPAPIPPPAAAPRVGAPVEPVAEGAERTLPPDSPESKAH